MMKVIECPRDAMQGIDEFIHTATKIEYLNKLLKVGFHTLDFGSFVSPKAIPQMRDTAHVLEGLHLDQTDTRLLAIVANRRGAEDACQFGEIAYLGFPLSLSETFQQRNTNKTIEEAFVTVEEIQTLCLKHSKQAVVYLSMGFGNPYGDPYEPEIVSSFIQRLQALGVGIVSLADTVGVATGDEVRMALKSAISAFPEIEIGAHLHVSPANVGDKLQAVFDSGCQRVDGALRGYGGCPMAKDELVGNMPTEHIIQALPASDKPWLDGKALKEALQLSSEVFLDLE